MKIAQTCQGDTLANLDQEGPNVKKNSTKICYADEIARDHLPVAGLCGRAVKPTLSADIDGRQCWPSMLAVNVGSYVAGLNCTVDGRSCCSHSTSHRDICRESRCLLTSPAFDAPVRWIHVGILPMEYLLWKNWNGVAIGLLKILKICLFVSTESTNVTG